MIASEEQWFIRRLRDANVSVNDKSSCLDVLEVLLPDRDVLPVLSAVIQDPAHPYALKKQAETFARTIDPDFVASETM